MSIFRDIGAQTNAAFMLIPVSITSSGQASTAAVEVSGPAFDRFTFSSRHLSGSLLVPHQIVLTSGLDASLAANMQHADTTVSSDFSDLGSSTHSLSYTGATGGTTVEAVLKINLDLTMAKRYLRAQVTPGLGTTTTGAKTFKYGGVLVLGSADELPSS